MSGLDIEALRLTEDEVDMAWANGDAVRSPADAQFTKLAWGFRDWVEAVKEDTDTVGAAYYEWLIQTFSQALEQADVKRPAAE